MAVRDRKRRGWKVPKRRAKHNWSHPVAAAIAVAGEIATGTADTLAEVEAFLAEALAVSATAEAIGAAGLPEDAPAEFLGLLIITTIVVVLIVVFLALMFVYALITLCRLLASKVPLVGNSVKQIFDPMLHEVERILHATWNKCESDLQHVWLFARRLFELFAIAAGLATETYVITHTKVIREHVKELRRHMHEVRQTIRSINKTIHTIRHDTSGVATPSLTALWVAVHTLQGEHTKTHHRIDHLAQRMTAVEDALASLGTIPKPKGHEFAKIEKELVSIRQRLTALENEPLVHGGLTTKQLHELHTAYHFATLLAPLTALYPLTKINISNLNKLKDDPCQCPQPPKPPPFHIGGGNALIDSIVADLVIKDGV